MSDGEDYEDVSSDEKDKEETRSLVRDQNRKKKKSGGFQAMGEGYIF